MVEYDGLMLPDNLDQIVRQKKEATREFEEAQQNLVRLRSLEKKLGELPPASELDPLTNGGPPVELRSTVAKLDAEALKIDELKTTLAEAKKKRMQIIVTLVVIGVVVIGALVVALGMK